MTATERFKRLLADALERVCVLEAELEVAHAELEQARDRAVELEQREGANG